MLYVLLVRQVLLILWFIFGYAIAEDLTDYMAQLSQLGSFMFLNCVSYLLYHLFLMRYSARYPYLNYNERSYILKNLTKSTFLGLLAFLSAADMIKISLTGIWPNQLLTTLGNVYVSTDLTGLLTVPGLSTSTQLHHTVVAILGLINILVDYSKPGIHRAMVVLTYLSVLPYLVNTMLGLRHLKIRSHLVNYTLPWMCIAIYSICVLFNASFQFGYVIYASEWSLYNVIFTNNLNITLANRLQTCFVNLIFLGAYYVILIDDYQLICYLYYKATQTQNPSDESPYLINHRNKMDYVLLEMRQQTPILE